MDGQTPLRSSWQVVHPSMDRVSSIPTGSGFFPSIVGNPGFAQTPGELLYFGVGGPLLVGATGSPPQIRGYDAARKGLTPASHGMLRRLRPVAEPHAAGHKHTSPPPPQKKKKRKKRKEEWNLTVLCFILVHVVYM